jgi:hypothetical protein
MNTHFTPPDHDDAQWQAQERARSAARNGIADADAGDLRVARALRQAPAPQLPVDFAAQVAGLARTQAANNSLLEQRLLRALTWLLGLSAAVTVAWFGRSWPEALAAALPGGSQAVGWSAVAALCVLGNWGWGLLRRQLEGRGHAPA